MSIKEVKKMSELAKNLRNCRENKGLTTTELAEKVGTSQSAISYFERGKKIPSVATLESIADTLEVSMDYLMGRRIEETA